MHLTLVIVSRIPVRPFVLPSETNLPVRHPVHISVLNGCRRARGAAYQHGNRRGCLRGTRETVLTEIESWAKDFDASPVFWLNGLAGTGKSTIAQTISELLFADGLLGASFFAPETSRTVATSTSSSPPLRSSSRTSTPTFDPASSLSSSQIPMSSTSRCTAKWRS